MNKFTHIAEVYGIRCFFNIETNRIKGTTSFNEAMIGFYNRTKVDFQSNLDKEIKLIQAL